jgi:hypothetical protein
MFRPTVGRSVSLGVFITVTRLRLCWCRAPYFTRGRVCRLQLLLALASAVILGSESRETHDHILLSQVQDFWRPRSPCLYPSETGWLSYIPRHWVPFSSPPTTRRATVDVFEPASQSQSQSYFTTGDLPPISLSWRQAPWDSRPEIFSRLNPCGHSPYVTS